MSKEKAIDILKSEEGQKFFIAFMQDIENWPEPLKWYFNQMRKGITFEDLEKLMSIKDYMDLQKCFIDYLGKIKNKINSETSNDHAL